MPRHVAVIDIGKTNAKVALVDLEHMREVAVRTEPNKVLRDGPYPHYDIERLWSFVLDGLAAVNREHPVDAISVTTHGATAVLLDADGNLAMPVLDYEHTGADTTAFRYDAVRPPFDETGSPRLPIGLNVGAQLCWQAETFPDEFARVASIVMYAQYWSYRLSGVLANELTSLGCHTDLWNPAKADFSSLVDSQGWRARMVAPRPARDRLGPLLPELAARTGIAVETPVYCGIHDSNASLLPHLLARKPPFAVVSTGTWAVSMAIGAKKVALDPARDTLVNVNAFGDPVPSARFMGGREFEMLSGGHDMSWTDADVASVLERRVMLLPSVQQGSGPFPERGARWLNNDGMSDGERAVAVAFYLALMTATCLGLIGTEGPIIVEGPLAKMPLYARMLHAATGRSVAGGGASTGTSIGAALLASSAAHIVESNSADEQPVQSDWAAYAAAWRAELS